MNWFIVFFSLINLSECIYEDQIGKFDWRQTYVGRIKFAQFDTVSTAKKIIVATEENVLAALHLKTGEVVWRHVFESASAGNIQLLHVSDKVITVNGANPYLVRGWNTDTGVLLWEWSLALNDVELADFSEWWVQGNALVHLLPVWGSHLEITMYNVMKGYNRGSTSKLPATWCNDGCVLSPPYYTCSSGDLLISVDVTSKAVQLISKPLSDLVNMEASEGNLRPLEGNSTVPGFVLDDQRVVLIRDDKFELVGTRLADRSASVTVVESAGEMVLLQAWNAEGKSFQLSGHRLSGGAEVAEFRGSGGRAAPEPALAAVLCGKRDQHVCRLLLSAADDAVHLVQQNGQVVWTREEALANVVAAEFVDLPVSHTDAAIEMEFDQREGTVWAAFVRRLHTQYHQLLALIQGWQGEGAADSGPEPLVRDYFNLHKILVLVTDAGKIFGMDNLSGRVLWSRYEPELDTEAVAVFARRSARHPPHDACLTIVGKHVETGNGYIISLNPIRGTPVEERTVRLGARLLQCSVLPAPDAHKLHALLLLDEREHVQIFPESAAPLVQNLYMYVAEKDSARIRGYALRYDGKQVVAQRTWSVDLAGAGGGTTAALAARARLERSRSPGRALPDRSVLYKYPNPNLLLAVVDKPDPVHKDTVTAAVLDAASGAVVAAATHRRARATPLALHADNFFAYVYRSDKHRRLEIATIELYEGKQRWLPAGAAFSSFLARAPGVSRQAYILPAAATAAGVTITERSLTDKHLLLALTTGQIVQMPWALLEPRRPTAPTAEQREEGLLPYAPELPLPAEGVVNYNRSLERVKAIYTAPSGLESTCLVLATGLDMFYTRVAPSKTFDLLKDDFEYYLIVLVLLGFLLATSTSKLFASWKTAKLAWK